MPKTKLEDLNQYLYHESTRQMIADMFTYHAPLPGQPERYTYLREQALELADAICLLTPPSREQSEALTHLETAVMFANAAIARNEPAGVSDVVHGKGEDVKP